MVNGVLNFDLPFRNCLNGHLNSYYNDCILVELQDHPIVQPWKAAQPNYDHENCQIKKLTKDILQKTRNFACDKFVWNKPNMQIQGQ